MRKSNLNTPDFSAHFWINSPPICTVLVALETHEARHLDYTLHPRLNNVYRCAKICHGWFEPLLHCHPIQPNLIQFRWLGAR
jgi:hypothetical protein